MEFLDHAVENAGYKVGVDIASIWIRQPASYTKTALTSLTSREEAARVPKR